MGKHTTRFVAKNTSSTGCAHRFVDHRVDPGCPEQRFKMRYLMITWLTSIVALTCSPLHSREIVDERFGFQLVVPDEFRAVPIDPTDRKTLYAFVDRDPNPDDRATVIRIQRLRITFHPDERISLGDIPVIDGIVTTSLQQTQWNGHTIDVVRQVMAIGDDNYMTYWAQFPLPDEAVQIHVGGPEERDAAIRKLFDQSVASFMNMRPIVSSGGADLRKLINSERLSDGLSGILRLGITFVVIACIVGFIGNKIRHRRTEGE